MPLPFTDRITFLILATISGCLFLWRFGPVIGRIRAAKRDPNDSLKIGPRIGAFLWEVLFQSKVIRDRPLPGLAHAFVFWGFLAFVGITLNHFAEGVGFELLPRGNPYTFAYRGFVALFAVTVATAITGLALRRFLLRPKWLGSLSWESGLIALLILVLMVTFLVGFTLSEETAAARWNWWIHTGALLLFLPLIPHTKHLHLILSPVAIFARRNGFSRIPPLADDDDFGLVAGKDITRVVALQAYSCVECGRCTEHCPAYNTGKELNPKEIILGVRRYMEEFGVRSDAPLVGKHITETAIFQCTTCGACEEQCPVGIQHLPVIIGLRRGHVNTGKWEDEYGTKLFLNLERNGNPMGFAASERQKFIEKNGLPLYDGSQQYCLWLGCMGSYDPQGRETVLALARVLEHLKISFGVLRRERCTGDSARRLGNDLLFQQLVESNVETMQQAGVRKLLSICPHCVRTIRDDWKEAGASFQIEHHSELLARYDSKLPPAAGTGEVVYHDPCYLGRYQGVYDEPRAVISAAAKLVEPPRTEHRSRCCGAGGGLVFLGEETGKRVNVDRAEELAATGAPTVAAACPFCHTMFRDAFGQADSQRPQLVDIAQIAAARLPADAAAPPQ